MRIAIIIVLFCGLGFGAGCQNGRLGRWGGSQFGQGSIDRQKARAVTTDPYPFNDIGPEVVGGRPREFASPMPEANRNELNPKLGIQGRGFLGR